MADNLSKVPRRSILKHNDSVEGPMVPSAAVPVNSVPYGEGALGRKSSKTATFDEMNILLTLHPAEKDYGHMKIEEPKTPFSYAYEEDEEAEAEAQAAADGGKAGGSPGSGRHCRRGSFGESGVELDSANLASRFRSGSDAMPSVLKPGTPEEEMETEDQWMTEEERQKKREFEAKRKAHYNEYMAVKMARKLIEEEDDDDDD